MAHYWYNSHVFTKSDELSLFKGLGLYPHPIFMDIFDNGVFLQGQ